MIQAVLDPGVLVSAVLTPNGMCASLLRRWEAGEYDLIVSSKLLEEFRGVMVRPKFRRVVTASDVDAMVGLLRDRAEFIADPKEPARVSRDPNDDYLISLARTADAILVSGDHDLTDLRIDKRIVSPSVFMRLLDDT